MADEAKAARDRLPAREKPVKKQENENKPRKPSYREKTEFDQLDAGIQLLEQEKEQLMNRMNSGDCSPAELGEMAVRYAELEQEIGLKTDRWLELSTLFE